VSSGASIVSSVCEYTVVWRNKESCFNSWQWQEIFLFSEKYRLVLKTTQRDIRSVLGDYSMEGVKKTTHTYLVLRSSISGPNHHPAYTIMAYTTISPLQYYNTCTCNDVTNNNNQKDNKGQYEVIIKFLKHKRPTIC